MPKEYYSIEPAKYNRMDDSEKGVDSKKGDE